MKRIILITGGERSGKSLHAETLALSLSSTPTYIATARVWDEDFRKRIIRHQKRRGSQWTNIEEEKFLSRYDVNGRVVLVDCLTLWATNYFYDATEDSDSLPETAPLLEEMKQEFVRFTSQDATFIFVTNEIGLGGVPINPVQRRFTDLLGELNQYVASQADEVSMMVCGIEVPIRKP